MKCRPCGEKAVIELPRHNSAFCPECFIKYFDKQLETARSKCDMFAGDDEVAVAVSGGKDSLALWHALLKNGVAASGVHVNLGIGDYSRRSQELVEDFARRHQAHLVVVDVQSEYGFGVREVARHTIRTACSACGLFKRYLLNKVATDHGFEAIATGHNLDDEASFLLGNLLHWKQGFLARQNPVLPAAHPKLTAKVKPLFRLTERETAAYCVISGIAYIIEECPLVRGSTNLVNKEVLNLLEQKSPGTKHAFYFDFLRKRPRFEETDYELRECDECGQVTTANRCSFCRLVDEVSTKMARRLPSADQQAQPTRGGPDAL